MRHHDHSHTALFDAEAVEASERRDELTEEFWGGRSDWSTRTGRLPALHRSERSPADDTTGAVRVIRDGVSAFRPQRRELRDATGQVRRTRAHGRPGSLPTIEQARAEATIGQLAAGHFDEQAREPGTAIASATALTTDDRPWPSSRQLAGPIDAGHGYVDLSDDLDENPQPATRLGIGSVDPLLARLGVMIVVGVLLVPLALAMRPADAADGTVEIEAPDTQVETSAGVAPAEPFDAPDAPHAVGSPSSSGGATEVADSAPAAARPAAVAVAESSSAAPEPSGTTSGSATNTAAATATATATDEPSTGDVTQSVTGSSASAIDEPATVNEVAERVEPECPQTYTAAPGDSWYRIAGEAGVTPSALLDENRATVDTMIFPGDRICLPAGASTPAPPATTVAPTTTTPSSTAAPTTTNAPTTTSPVGSPGRDATPDEVRAVIRSIFPASEWETAYVIADRESRFIPTAYNGWCCYGVFQIYWNVHRSWLDELGIDSADDLYDPLLNVRAAYAIYQRAGNSWTPWSTYDG